ncbi:MAG: hypothetical protein KGI45_01460 [Patescibacteria group bacterium]|nr:hypothetical protein [Patescibacteria group bacterium]
MRNGKRAWSFKRFLSSTPALILAVIVFAATAKAVWNIHEKTVESADRLAQAQAALSDLEAHKADLQAEIGRLDTSQGLEAELRSKYRAVKEGESVAVIIDPADSASSSGPTSTPSLGWWQRALQWVGF